MASQVKPDVRIYTVPHSGTRYVMIAHGDAGVLCDHRHTHENNMKQHCVEGLDPDIKHAIVLRDPVMTWKTWWGKATSYGDARKRRYHLITHELPAYYAGMLYFMEEFPDCPIYRIEDGIEQFGMKPHGRTASVNCDMTGPVLERNIEEIKRLDEGHNLWPVFTDQITPMIYEVYNKYYDFWWAR